MANNKPKFIAETDKSILDDDLDKLYGKVEELLQNESLEIAYPELIPNLQQLLEAIQEVS